MPKKQSQVHFSLRCLVLAALWMVLNTGAWAQAPKGDSGGSDAQNDAQTPAAQPDDSSKPNQRSLMTPLKPVTQEGRYVPITDRQRLRWFITNTIGPPHMAGGLFTSAFGTALDRPKEYGPHWGGFADRYGMRLTGIIPGNAIEASVGSLWGEDPRYFRATNQPFKARVNNIVRLTFVARRPDGSFQPAYARYIGVSGNNFLSNAWRVDSEANTHDAILRTAEGFAGRMAANAFEEFWPDAKAYLFHHHRSTSDPGSD
jgi:hypothetical protein